MGIAVAVKAATTVAAATVVVVVVVAVVEEVQFKVILKVTTIPPPHIAVIRQVTVREDRDCMTLTPAPPPLPSLQPLQINPVRIPLHRLLLTINPKVKVKVEKVEKGGLV
jgi:hypothetical protein